MNRIAVLAFAFACVFSVLAADAADALSGQDMSATLSRLDKAMPTARKTAQRPEKIDNADISKTPFFGIRTVFTREYMTTSSAQVSGTAGAERMVKAYDYTDVLMIPVESTFRIDKALAMAGVTPSATKLDFVMYGLEWRRLDNEYHTATLYLGTDGSFYYFAHATLPNIVALKRVMGLRDGFDEAEILAEALNIADKDDFTKKFAVISLARIKDAAIPFIKGAIREARKLDAGIFQHFQTLCLINTEKSTALLTQYALDDDPAVYLAVFDSVIKGTKPSAAYSGIYKRMISTMTVIPYAVEAAKMAGIANEMLPVLDRAAAEPDTFEHYSIATTSAFALRNPGKKTIHQDALKQIMLFLMRNGEVSNSIKTVSLENKTPDASDYEMSREDKERVKPFFDAIVNSPDTILNVVCALSMLTFDTSDRLVAKGYILRVRMYGLEMLEALPRDIVRGEMLKLIRSLKTASEKEMVRSAYYEIFGRD